MIILTYFIVSGLPVFILINFLKFKIFLEEKLVWAISLGVVLQTIVIFLLSLWLGFTKNNILLFLGLNAIISIFLILKNRDFLKKEIKSDLSSFKERFKKNQLNVFLLLLIVFLIFFGTLWPKVFYYDNSGNIFTIGTPGVWGDWALHSAYVSHFAYSDKIFLTEPIFSGNHLSYTFLADFLSAVLMKIGVGFIPSMIIPGFLFSLFFIVVFYYFVFRLTGKENIALLAIFLFLLGGGLGFFYFFEDIKDLNFNEIFDFLKNSNKEYTNLPDKNIRWTSFLNALFLPQRPLTMGIVIGIIILTCLSMALEKRNLKWLFFAGISAGLLPTLHIHTLVAISIAGFFLIIFLFWPKKDLIIKNLIIFFLPVVIFGIWQMFAFFPSGIQNFKIQLGWMAQNDNWILFWIKNLGLFFLLLPLVFWRLDKRLKMIYLSFISLFLITNIIIFQPYDYDNLKILIYWFILNAIIFSIFLTELWKRNIYTKIGAVLIGFTLMFSSFLDVSHLYLREGYLLFSKKDIEFAENIKNNTSVKDIFLTSDQHNNPVLALVGRDLVMGYRGWLWSHGIDYQEREKDVLSMLQGSDDVKELLKKYNVSYVMMGLSEKKDFFANDNFYSQNYPVFLETEGIKIYKIKKD